MFIGEKLLSRTESNVNALWTVISLFLAKSAISLCDSLHLHPLISLRKITLELSTIRRGTFMKSALKKSVVSTSISLILASGMAAFAAHAADDVKLKATKTNVAFRLYAD